MTTEPPHWAETLSALVHELDETKTSCDQAAAAALQTLRNFIALAPFANPECLPPFSRKITDGPRKPPTNPDFFPRNGRRPMPSGIPYPRRPRDMD